MGWLKFLTVTSFRSLLRSPRRTMISLMSIAAAAASMIIFQSFVDGIRTSFRSTVIHSRYAHFEISRKGFANDDLDDPFAYQIKDSDQLKKDIEASVAPLDFFGKRQKFYGLVGYNDRSYGGMGWGVDAAAERSFLSVVQVKEGKHLAECDNLSIFVSSGLAAKLRLTLGDSATVLATTSTGSINALDLEVCGIYETGVRELDASTFMMHHSAVEELLVVEGAHQILLAFKDDADLINQEPLEKLLADKYPDYQSLHWRVRANFFDTTMAWVEKQIFVFRIIVLLIATLSIVNVFTMGLMERTAEFGTLRAIGTNRSEIASMIFGESIVQAVFGCLMGIALACFIILVPLSEGITMPPPPLMSVPFEIGFAIPWHDLLPIVGLCTFVAGGAGIFPAIKIARMNIIKALGRMH